MPGTGLRRTEPGEEKDKGKEEQTKQKRHFVFLCVCVCVCSGVSMVLFKVFVVDFFFWGGF